MKQFIFIAVVTFFIPLSLYARITCKNFDTQAEAQVYFDARKYGWKKLDGDKDGEPCECLRGGSSYHKTVCKKWRRKHRKQ